MPLCLLLKINETKNVVAQHAVLLLIKKSTGLWPAWCFIIWQV